MSLPRDVSRYLEAWGYEPLSRNDFGYNYLSTRVGSVQDRAGEDFPAYRPFASLCAVPRGRPRERFADFEAMDKWLDENARQYDPPGIWIPFRGGKSYTSHGLVRAESIHADDGEWEKYLLMARDGYVEYGALCGHAFSGRRYVRYAPIVAWIRRFAAFVQDLRTGQGTPAEYWIVLNLLCTDGARLGVLGHGWLEPWDAEARLYTTRYAIEDRVRLSRDLAESDTPEGVSRWFAERIANAFGELTPRCYNREESTAGGIGELPGGLGLEL